MSKRYITSDQFDHIRTCFDAARRALDAAASFEGHIREFLGDEEENGWTFDAIYNRPMPEGADDPAAAMVSELLQRLNIEVM